MRAVLDKLADWVTRNDRAIEVSYGGDTLKLGGRLPSSRRRSSMTGSPGTRPLLTRLKGRGQPWSSPPPATRIRNFASCGRRP